MATLKKRLYQLVDLMAVLLLTTIVTIVILQIVFRYLLHFAAPWTEELARYLYVYLVFVAAILVTKEKSQIEITVVLERLPRRIRLGLGVFYDLLIILFLWALTNGAFFMMGKIWNSRSASMSWFRMSYLYYPIIVCSVVMVLIFLTQAWEKIKLLRLPEAGTRDEMGGGRL